MRLFYYKDEELYCHHSLDERPVEANFRMHAHEMLEIYHFISGDAAYMVEGRQYALTPGDVMIMRAAETHKLQLGSDAPYERIAIHFSKTLLSGLDPEGRLLRPFYDRELGHYNRFAAGSLPAERLAACFGGFDMDVGDERLARLHVLSRLLPVLTELSLAFSDGTPDSAGVTGPAAGIVAYVNDRLFGELSLEAVSREFYMSRSQLERTFRRATGSSLWEYVKIKRLLAARERIASGEGAAQAAASCGFRDYSAFYRAYRRHFGHSPVRDAPERGAGNAAF